MPTEYFGKRDENVMTIDIGQYRFDGPYTTTDDLEDRSGIYVILCYQNNEYIVIDVGESATVRSRVDNHDRKDCWGRKCQGVLYVVVYYTPNLQQPGRMAIEQEIRDTYNPPCGER